MKSRFCRSLIACLFQIALTTGWAHAAPGDLDPSFSLDGLLTTDVPNPASSSFAQGVALQDDGKIVVAGVTSFQQNDFAVVRYNPDGSLDPSFGSGGIVTTNFAGVDPNFSTDVGLAVVIQPDGKIVVGGNSNDDQFDLDFALARYNADGSLDSSFGGDGLVVTDFLGIESNDTINGLALQADGKILAVGSASLVVAGPDDVFALARYNPDGSLDSSFGGTGLVQTRFSAISDDFAEAVQVQPDGQIVVAGASNLNLIGSENDFALARYHPNGSLDPSFGTGGLVRSNFFSDPVMAGIESDDIAFDLVLQADGRIVAAGSYFTFTPLQGDFALARYNSDGSLDPSFGTGGLVQTGFTDIVPGSFANGNGLDLYQNGKLIVSGGLSTSLLPPLSDFALARYNSDGSLDAGFGAGGKVVTPFPGNNFTLSTDVVIQPDSKVVAVGLTGNVVIEGGNGSFQDFAVARYLGDVADLSIEKTANVSEITVGQGFTYNLAVSNLGPDPAGGVIVSDTLPSSLQIQDATPSQGSCTVTGQDLECDLGNMNVGDVVNISIDVLATADTGSVTNTATVSGQVEDPVIGNNTSTLILNVVQAGNLEGSGISCGLNPASSGTSRVFAALAMLALGSGILLKRSRAKAQR